MAYVKLDCGMLDSTLWIDRCARELFITSLLMAEPRELLEPMRQIKVRSLEFTDFSVPPGWYGFVPAAGVGIIRRCGIDQESGMQGLERLGEPEADSRSSDFGGRRMVRVDGGWIILNFDRYRNKDHTAAERSRRYRERKAKTSRVTSSTSRVTSRSATQAEAEADITSTTVDVGANGSHPASKMPFTDWLNSLSKDPAYKGIDVEREYQKMTRWCEVNKKQANKRRFINWLNRADQPIESATSPAPKGRNIW